MYICNDRNNPGNKEIFISENVDKYVTMTATVLTTFLELDFRHK